MNWLQTPCIAFEGSKRIAKGGLQEVALACKPAFDKTRDAQRLLPLLIFDAATSETIEVDWRGDLGQFAARLLKRAAELEANSEAPEVGGEEFSGVASLPGAPSSTTLEDSIPDLGGGPGSLVRPNRASSASRGPGRPKLGVVAREVTLLPRHWDWLSRQTGGASVALRKLVEVARLSSESKDRERQTRAVGYRFMSTMAGHEVGFEEASRALFAGNRERFDALIASWPEDVQAHLKTLLADAFGDAT